MRPSTRPRLALDQDQSMAYFEGECSYRRLHLVRRFNVGRVLVLNNPPASEAAVASASAVLALATAASATLAAVAALATTLAASSASLADSAPVAAFLASSSAFVAAAAASFASQEGH